MIAESVQRTYKDKYLTHFILTIVCKNKNSNLLLLKKANKQVLKVNILVVKKKNTNIGKHITKVR